MSPASTSSSEVLHVIPHERNPRKWSKSRRWYIALVIWNLVAPIDMSTTLYSGAQEQIKDRFNVSRFVVTLGVGLVNFGIAVGPLVAAPLSELYGRQPIYIGSSIAFTAFSLGAALSQSITTLLVCRALGGILGAAVFSNFGGSLLDLFTPDERGPPVAVFALVLQGAPTIGPVPGSFMGQYVNWRWIMGLSAIWGVVMTGFVLFLPETEAGKIGRTLAKEEKRGLEPESSSRVVVFEKRGILQKEIWGKALLTPLVMLCFEPIVLTTSLYHVFIYGLLFILLEAYPFVYSRTYNMTLSQTGLTFISPWIGNVAGVLLYFGYFKPAYEAKQRVLRLRDINDTTAQQALHPEARLPGMILSSFLVPLGLFWFALTLPSSSHNPSANPILWPAPVLSGIPIGAGMTLLQLSLSNYYIDLYPTLSASALAVNLFVRNILATGFPMLAILMYELLGDRNAGLLLAGISTIGIPAGGVLYIWGKKLRGMSRRAKQDEAG